MGVVDPGVGSDRGAVVMRADGRWFIGPGQRAFLRARGAVDGTPVLADHERSGAPRAILSRPRSVRADGGVGRYRRFSQQQRAGDSGLQVSLWAGDLAEVAYIDHYGNAFTGIRAADICSEARVKVSGREVPHARVFSAVAPGEVVWYENSIGLVEIAVNQGSAADQLGLAVGDAVVIVSG